MLRNRDACYTRRETEVTTLVVARRLHKQAAAELGTSEITLNAHRAKLMRSLMARSLPDLARMEATLGVVA